MLKKTSLFLLTTIIISCGTNFIALANTIVPKLYAEYESQVILEDNSNNNLTDIARIYEIIDNTISLKETKNNYLASYTMEATAYSGDIHTATGVPTKRDADGISTIAVDPTVIPLGSKVYIPEYGYAIASDTGGAIKGHKIDLFLNSEEECVNWGRQPVTLHLIAPPCEW